MALTKKESTREGSRMKAQDQKELMRERICDCAKRLFEREGYEQVSMRQIAAEAGIAVGNLTYYFSKKEDLLKERLNDIQETFSESIQLFEIDLERGEISGKPFWEYENRTLLELLLRFLKAVEQFQKNAAIVYENYSRLQKTVPVFQEMSREWTEKIMTIYNGLIKQLWERRVFRKELEWDEYENLIYLIKLLTFFRQEMHGDQEYEKKQFTERICRLLIPYISWEWKDTYTVLCKEICEVSFHRMTLKFI